MRLEIHAECLGEMSGLEDRGDATFDRDIAAQKIGGALSDPRNV